MLRLAFDLKWLLLICVLFAGPAQAAEATLFMTPAAAKPGEIAEIPVMIDRADRLAGIRLVIAYAADALEFKGAVKSGKTSALMDVVNDKVPGVLIIVMAGARGVTADAFPLTVISFAVKPNRPQNTTAWLQIKEAELVSEHLENIVPILPPDRTIIEILKEDSP